MSMEYWRLWLGFALAISILGVALSFFRKTLFHIPNLAFEIIGVFIVGFVLGHENIVIWFLVIFPAAIIAAIYDPIIWKKQGYVTEGENIKKFSWVVNMAVLGASILGFFAGYIFVKL